MDIPIYYDTDAPILGDQSIFSNEIYTVATLYVRESAMDIIDNTVPWKLFSKVESYDFAGIENVNEDVFDYETDVYNLNGVKISNSTVNLTPGTYIIRHGKSIRKVLVR